MRVNKKAMIAAGLLLGAAALTGCTAQTKPVATPTPQAAQQATAQPATAQPQTTADAQPSPDSGDLESPASLALTVAGEEAAAGAIIEGEKLMLPLIETGELLGWKAGGEETEEETQTKRVVTLEKDESRITVSWTVSDNTAKSITWQKDGLLIPVDTRITTVGDVVYVPAAFFEEAMDVSVAKTEKAVRVEPERPSATPETYTQEIGENG
ncbi:MAG: hypothetical protein IKU73_05745 [Clostridia bacterium]|nr:hypothetical protein [Clostridia bacterium]